MDAAADALIVVDMQSALVSGQDASFPVPETGGAPLVRRQWYRSTVPVKEGFACQSQPLRLASSCSR